MGNSDTITVFEDTMTRAHIVMASIMYTFALCPFVGVLYLIFKFDLTDIILIIQLFAYAISISVFFVVPAIKISEEYIVKVDLDKKKLFNEYRVVFYKKIEITDVENFDYVAVNSTTFGYTITLWYQYNGYRHIALMSFYKKEKAFTYAKSLCRVLNVDLLNKIDINKPIWIDKSEL